MAEKTEAATAGNTPIERYYRIHSKIYDATRWSFLFGRKTVIRELQARRSPANILEVGCGTGKNLTRLLDTFPEAKVTGLDLSAAMLDIARAKTAGRKERISLVREPYEPQFQAAQAFDAIVFSYALSMFNPGWERAVDTAKRDLAPGGMIAVVDFHHSPSKTFRRWMGVNHVRMERHLPPKLRQTFNERHFRVHHAYGGVWNYFVFIGEK